MGNKLTEREKDVLFCLCKKGLLNKKSIAKDLIVSKTTVSTHIDNLFKKTQTHNIENLMIKYFKGKLNEYI